MYVCICLLLDIHVKQPIPFDHLVVMRPYFKQNEVRTSCSRSFWRSCLFSHPPSTGYNKNTTCGYVILCSWVFGGSYYIKFICKKCSSYFISQWRAAKHTTALHWDSSCCLKYQTERRIQRTLQRSSCQCLGIWCNMGILLLFVIKYYISFCCTNNVSFFFISQQL